MKKMNRRQFLKALAQVSAAYTVGGIGLAQYGRYIEPEWLTVEQISIPLKNLNPSLEGFKIVQLSDIHIDAYTHIEVIHEAVTITNNLKPDLILLTGDYVQSDAEAILDLIPILSGLNAKYGVFTILGNHELWTNPAFARESLEKAGFPVLVNQGISLGAGQAGLYLAGLDDGWSGHPDLKAALEQHSTDLPVILMAHEPDLADTFSQDGRVSLQLSGHSHGGQIRLPGYGAFVLPLHGRKYDLGLYNVNDMWLYTNRGLGLAPIAYRINCPPEVTEITLVAV